MRVLGKAPRRGSVALREQEDDISRKSPFSQSVRTGNNSSKAGKYR